MSKNLNKRGAIKLSIIIFLVIANILVLTLFLSPTKAIPQDFYMIISRNQKQK